MTITKVKSGGATTRPTKPTEYELLRSMLERELPKFDIEYAEENGYNIIRVERGYNGFVSVLTFRPDGSLKDVEAFE